MINYYSEIELSYLALDTPGSTITTVLRKVNCYESDTVCKQLDISTFPNIQFYRNGKYEGRYKGFYDEKDLTRTIRLLQQPAMMKLKGDSEIELYLAGKHPMPASSFVDTCVLGMFDSEDDSGRFTKDFFQKILIFEVHFMS